MNNISVNYDLKWQFKTLPYYKWSTCGKLFNTRTGRRLKKTVNGRSVGYWIAGKFLTLNTLRSQLEKYPHQQLLGDMKDNREEIVVFWILMLFLVVMCTISK